MAVTRLEIRSRQPFAQGRSFGDAGPYEQLDGIAHFAVDPEHPTNEVIADLNLAPRNGEGKVTFSADFRILRPADPQRGNRRMLLDVLNRGKQLALKVLNSAPEVPPDAPLDPGNGFLMRQGYTVAWCGWQRDVPDQPGLLGIRAPEAMAGGGPVSGRLVVTFQPNAPAQVQFLSDRGHRPYPASDVNDPQAVLTVQDHEDAPEQVIPREQWAFARRDSDRVVPDPNYIYMESGFAPGKVYQVVYSTNGAPVVGVGLLATRDMASFLRYGSQDGGNPCAGGVDYAYSFGQSQSGRFLRHFLYLGLNRDEDGNTVFDGVIPHVAGGKRGEFNHRFAQPSSQASRSPNNLFPFSDVEQTDPETGIADGLLSRLVASGALPRIMYTNTSSEYWGGHGALVHTDLAGIRDMPVPDAVRIYLLASTQHSSGALPLSDYDAANGYRARHPFNCLDYRPLLRAALVNLDRWVTTGAEPPPSNYPRLDKATAVSPERVEETFRRFPEGDLPHPLRRIHRLDFGMEKGATTRVPPAVGKPYPNLVSSVDADGNETGGIRLPYITVPLATYTGWNRRHPDIGGAGQVMASGGASGGTLLGSTISFARTMAERESTGDPRPSIEERYPSREAYLEQVRQAARDLVDQGYLLDEDLETVASQAEQLYQALASGAREPQAADN